VKRRTSKECRPVKCLNSFTIPSLENHQSLSVRLVIWLREPRPARSAPSWIPWILRLRSLGAAAAIDSASCRRCREGSGLRTFTRCVADRCSTEPAVLLNQSTWACEMLANRRHILLIGGYSLWLRRKLLLTRGITRHLHTAVQG